MNQGMGIVRLATEPELSYTPNTQTPICEFRVAVERPRRNGEDQGTDFFAVKVIGNKALSCNTYLKKGRLVGLTGRLQVDNYTKKDGTKGRSHTIIADNVEFLPAGGGGTTMSWTFSGNLANDPEDHTPNGSESKICHITVAVSRPKKNGMDQGADFIRFSVFGRQAEFCLNYLKTGRPVAIIGRLETSSYVTAEGAKVNTVGGIASRVIGLGSKDGSVEGQSYDNGSYAADTYADAAPDIPDSFESAEDDIPF